MTRRGVAVGCTWWPLLRVGRVVVQDCREMWPHLALSPELLAARVLREGWIG